MSAARYLTFVIVLLQPLRLAGQEGAGAEIRTEELSKLLEKARAEHDLPALAAGVVRPGGQPVVVVTGVRKRRTDSPATIDDPWHLGSNTKPITALLLALLVDLGLIDWDTPLDQVFPVHADKWNADLKSITPAHLLTHTAGLPPNWPGGWTLIGRETETPVQNRKRVVESLDKIKPRSKPGERYEYSNLGYVLLGAIIDRRGKSSWEDQIAKRIFQPLGIRHWGLGHVINGAPWPHEKDGEHVPNGAIMDNPSVMNSAGRLHMPVGDYLRFLAETLRLARGEKGLLRPATAKRMFTIPHPVSPHSLSGWLSVGHPGEKGLVLEHAGSNTLNYCVARILPDQNIALCVLTNQGGPGGPGDAACHELEKQILRAVKK
jgi:CubicO group peptidase (beta-lactamase class C family)